MFPGISVLKSHIHKRGETAVILRRHRSLKEIYVSDNIGIERREQTRKMIDLIQGHIVEHTQILITVAPVHIHSRQSLNTFNNTRLPLHRLNDIAFSEQNRSVTHFVSRYLFCTDLSGFDGRRFESRHHDDLIEHFCVKRGHGREILPVRSPSRRITAIILFASEHYIFTLNTVYYVCIFEDFIQHRFKRLIIGANIDFQIL